MEPIESNCDIGYLLSLIRLKTLCCTKDFPDELNRCIYHEERKIETNCVNVLKATIEESLKKMCPGMDIDGFFTIAETYDISITEEKTSPVENNTTLCFFTGAPGTTKILFQKNIILEYKRSIEGSKFLNVDWPVLSTKTTRLCNQRKRTADGDLIKNSTQWVETDRVLPMLVNYNALIKHFWCADIMCLIEKKSVCSDVYINPVRAFTNKLL